MTCQIASLCGKRGNPAQLPTARHAQRNARRFHKISNDDHPHIATLHERRRYDTNCTLAFDAQSNNCPGAVRTNCDSRPCWCACVCCCIFWVSFWVDVPHAATQIVQCRHARTSNKQQTNPTGLRFPFGSGSDRFRPNCFGPIRSGPVPLQARPVLCCDCCFVL